MFKKGKALQLLLAVTIAIPMPTIMFGGQAAYAEGVNDPAPFINAKVVNENAGKKVLFDNTHAQTAGAADWVIDGAFSDFGNGLANAGYYVKELRKSTPITLDDLKDYDVFVIGEANIPYKTSEQEAMLQYVQQGGSIFFISDHYNADRNKNRYDASEVFNGYRRGAWDDPAKGMSADERNSAAMQGVQSSDWLSTHFGVRFRYNALGDITANNIVPPDQAFGITAGVKTVAMHAGSTIAITDPKKAKGIVYLPQTNAAWGNAVDQGVYNGGGVAEGPYVAVAKAGLGKAAFIGDSSPVEDASPKYKREENGSAKKTYDGFKEQDDATLLVNTVNWLSKKESYTSLDQVSGLQLDQPTKLLPIETPQTSTEPQAEPWAAPAAGYKWYDPSTFRAGSYNAPSGGTGGGDGGTTQPPQGTLTYTFVKQNTLPNAQEFKVRITADGMVPNSTASNYQVGIYMATGGAQVGMFQTESGAWPTSYGYSANFGFTADALGHAVKEFNVKLKPGSTGAANLRLRQVNGSSSTNLKTEAVTLGNVPTEPLPEDKPPVPATTTVADVRSKAAGTMVTTEGVVTTQPGIFGGQGFYLQDADAGIYVYQTTAGFNPGDKVKVTGKVDVYNTEMELTDLVAIEKIGTVEVPAPAVATEINEQNQGELITLENVQIQNLASVSANGTFEFDAVAGEKTTRVRVDNRTGLTFDQFPYHDGQTVTVSGVAAIFKGVNQLKPRGLSDFAADTAAPTTEAVLSGTANDNGWYNQDVTVTLNATDNNAVAATEYQVTEGIWNVYSGPFTISNEGTTTVQYRSRDVNGNAEEVKSVTVNLDKTAPATQANVSGEANANGWHNQDVTVTLEATDATSGAAVTEVKVNDGAWAVYQGALTVSEGTNTIQYRTVDKAGNAEEVKSVTVKLDKTAPTATLTQAGQAVHNVNIEGSLSFNLTGTDALSGVAATELYLDNNKINAGTELSAVSIGLGVHTVTGRVTDAAGNVNEVNFTFLIETSFQSIDNLIENFVQAGEFRNHGASQSIIAKLNTAESFYAKGNDAQAVKHLQDLQKSLSDDAAKGKVSQNAATVLSANIDYLLTHGLK